MKHTITKKKFLPFKQKSFRFALLAIVVSVLLSSTVIYIAFHTLPERDASLNLQKAQQGINKELQTFAQEGATLANTPGLADALTAQDSTTINSLLVQKTNERGTKVVAVANANGFVIDRTSVAKKVGDNFFLNNPLGREMVKTDANNVDIGISTVDPRLVTIASGNFVQQGDKKVGALFSGYLANDTYASFFAKQYFKPGTFVAFYTKEYGLSGSSIVQPMGKALLVEYLHPELDIIQKDHTQRFVLLPDGRFFLVQNLWLPGLENSMGGMLIFIPLTHLVQIVTAGIFLPWLIFFLVLFFVHRNNKKTEKNLWLSSPFIISLMVIYFVSVTALAFGFYDNFVKFQNTPYPLYNSILRFQPEGGVFDRRFAQRLSVLIDTGGEAINTIRLSLSYNPQELTIQSVDMARSICKNFILNNHNSLTGTIEMECIIPNPGFSGNSAVVTDLFFKANNKVTVSSVHFLNDSQVLANDGLATNVLRMAIDASLRFDDGQAIDQQKSLIIFSPTHPNPERWYSNKTVSLLWTPALPAVLTVNGNSAQKSPDSLAPLHYTVLQDGIYNFAATAKNNVGEDISGNVTAKIDTTPPEELTLNASETNIKPGGLVRFTASGKDYLSGLQRVFYLKINNEIFFPIGAQIYIPFPQAGDYMITLRAYDQAGNFRDVSKKIIVNRYQ